MSKKQYSTASTKLDYKKMARDFSIESIKLQRIVNEQRKEIKRLTEALQQSQKFIYMAETEQSAKR